MKLSREDVSYMVDHASEYTTAEFMEMFGIKRSHVESVMKKFGLKPKRSSVWNDAAVELLSSGRPSKEIAKLLGVTVSAVQNKAYHMGINIKRIRHGDRPKK